MAEEVVSLVARLEDNVSNAAYRVIKALDDIGDKARGASPKVKALESATNQEANAARNAAAANYLNSKAIGKMGKEALRTEIKMRLLERRMRKMARAGAMGGGRGGNRGRGRGGGGDIGGAIAGVGGMPITMFFAAASAVAALLPALSAAVGALGAAALGAVGALAPLGGLLIAYPGYLAAIGQGLVVTKMAFSGVGEAVKALTDPGSSLEDINIAMAKLGPSGQAFARNIAGMKSSFDGLTKNVQSILLPSFNEIVNIGQTYMPMVRKQFEATAFAIRGAVQSFGQFLEEERTQRQLGTILQTNTKVVKEFANAGVSGTRLFVNLLEAAGPLLTRMAQDIRAFVDRLAASSSANTQGLFNFFDSTYNVLKKTTRILSDFSAAIYNIASIGVPLGSAMGDSFLKMAENFRAFTESTEGVGNIRAWFIEMTPVLYEMGYLVRDVSKALFGLGGSGDTFTMLSQTLRQDLLPLFTQFVQNISSNFIPTLLELIKIVMEFFTAIDPLAAIIPILTVIGAVAKGVVDVFQLLGGAGKVLAAVFIAALFTIKLTTMALVLLGRAKMRAAFAARTLNTVTGTLNTGLKKVGISATIAAVGIKGMMLATGAIGIALMVVGGILSTFIGKTEDAISANETWAQSLFDVNGALAENAVQQIASTLATDGTLEALNKLGIESGVATDAILNGGTAWDTLISRLRELEEEAKIVKNVWGDDIYNANSKAAVSIRNLIDSLTGQRNAVSRARTTNGYYVDELGNLTTATDEASDASKKLLTSMQKLDAFFSQRQSERAYRQDMRDLRKTLKDLGKEYGVNQLATDQVDASIEQFVGNQMARANKLAEEGNFTEAFKIMETVSADAMRILTKNLGKDKATAAFEPIQTMINDTLTSLQALSREQFTIKVGYQGLGQIPSAAFPNIPNQSVLPENRFAGGPIVGGRTYMVGELGPEAFVGRNGNVSMIGKNGPEVTRFPQGGYVVPNHVLGGANDSSVPSNVMGALANAVQTKASSSPSGEYQIGDRPINIHIGSINQATEFDVAKAIKKGILEAERNRRERS